MTIADYIYGSFDAFIYLHRLSNFASHCSLAFHDSTHSDNSNLLKHISPETPSCTRIHLCTVSMSTISPGLVQRSLCHAHSCQRETIVAPGYIPAVAVTARTEKAQFPSFSIRSRSFVTWNSPPLHSETTILVLHYIFLTVIISNRDWMTDIIKTARTNTMRSISWSDSLKNETWKMGE